MGKVELVEIVLQYVRTILEQYCNNITWSTFFGQNIYMLFHILAKFPFTASETEQYYFQQMVNIRVISWVTEQLMT